VLARLLLQLTNAPLNNATSSTIVVLPLKATIIALLLLLHGLPASLAVKVYSHIKDFTGSYLPWQVYIPSDNYGMATRVSLFGGTAVSIRLDGIVYLSRTSTATGLATLQLVH
jgi:hypothetical protein